MDKKKKVSIRCAVCLNRESVEEVYSPFTGSLTERCGQCREQDALPIFQMKMIADLYGLFSFSEEEKQYKTYFRKFAMYIDFSEFEMITREGLNKFLDIRKERENVQNKEKENQ